MLTFDQLREANMARLPQFKNAKGERAHSEPDGSDWTLNDWYTATSGELGELGNLLKKVRRGDTTLAEAQEAIGKEIADVVIYLDILAMQCGVKLDIVTINKFNEVSKRVGANVELRYHPETATATAYADGMPTRV